MNFSKKVIETDVLIIGGGTAGCFCALTLAEQSDTKVVIAEKADIKRSGCLAAGVNALNAYLNEGETPDTFLEYVKKEGEDVVREDLIYTIAERLNAVTEKMESLGLPILKDENGKYASRGKRSIKINGENIKPLLAKAVYEKEQITVLNKINVLDYIVKDGKVLGACGFSIESNEFYVIYAKSTVCAAGGAAGLYKPNNPGFSRHKMWYSPFNTGAGYAMGIRAGAEMTSFENRFIALRCKDTIAPTGTVAQGVKTPQVNSSGEKYVQQYGKPTTTMRLHSTIVENEKGKGPCYLQTVNISEEQEEQLFKAYLNMAPAQTLKWMEHRTGPRLQNIEIEGTEPYIVGGHTSSGYWVDVDRKTTLKNLYAVGDVTGGSPKKYVTGCFAEAEMAAYSIIDSIQTEQLEVVPNDFIDEKIKALQRHFEEEQSHFTIESIEEAMQKVMDEYAGGISQRYRFTASRLVIALERIEELLTLAKALKAEDMRELLSIYEIIDRLYVCKVLIHHLLARKETRWKGYQENLDYQQKDDQNWMKYVNSVYKNGEVQILYRDIVKKGERYEHTY